MSYYNKWTHWANKRTKNSLTFIVLIFKINRMGYFWIQNYYFLNYSNQKIQGYKCLFKANLYSARRRSGDYTVDYYWNFSLMNVFTTIDYQLFNHPTS